MSNHQEHINFIWQIADLLRGPVRVASSMNSYHFTTGNFEVIIKAFFTITVQAMSSF